jgi:magnesium transporter
VIVDRALYVEGQREADGDSPREDLARARATSDAFVWVGLHEPTDEEFGEVREAFDLHPLAVEDAIHAHQRPKLERYGDILFVVLKTASYVDRIEAVDVGEIMLFVANDFVVTVRHGEYTSLSRVRQQLELDPDLLTQGPSAVLHAVADQVVDDYAGVLAGLDNDIEEIEEQVFTDDRENHAKRIYRLKREVLAFRKAVAPLPDALEDLNRVAFRVGHDLHEYFRDVHDHAVRATDHIVTLDELLNSALNANLAQIAIRQNEDMRKISAWVAIAAVPTALAGIYGMNFEHMPELEWRYGYFLVVAIMVTLCTTLYRLFKRSGWL